MPSWSRHIAQVDHNERTYLYLNRALPDYLDWQVTCLFYAALHYADAYLHHVAGVNTAHSQGHGERNRLVLMYIGLPVAAYYKRLQDQSENARYRTWQFNTAEVQRLYAHEFSLIRVHVRTALNL